MPKIVNCDQYRQELLHKCFDLFAQKGYSIAMRQIALALGVSTGTLYHYFPSKKSLYLQLVKEQTQQDILNFLLTAGNPPTLSERLETLFNFITENEDYFLKQISLRASFYQQQEQTEVLNKEVLKQADVQTIRVIADYLRSDIAIADFVLNSIYGLLLQCFFENKTVSFSQQSALLSQMLGAYQEQKQSATLLGNSL